MRNLTIALFAALCLAATAAFPAWASVEVLGFRLGVQTLDETREQLAGSGARFDDRYGYKGFSDLPSVRVDHYDRFARLGTLREGWLLFDHRGRLYHLEAVFGDAGETFRQVKDALDEKYGAPRTESFGFEATHRYRAGDVEVELHRNTFGFGSAQTTKLTYSYTPLLSDVAVVKRAIDDHIREQNAARVGGDL